MQKGLAGTALAFAWRRMVLVVDDDSVVRDAVVEALEEAGCAVCCAASLGEAKRFLGRARPDWILSDLDLDGCDGSEILAVVRGHPEGPPVVFVSARVEERQRLVALGAEDFLPKPFDLDVLLDVSAAWSWPEIVESADDPTEGTSRVGSRR